MLEKLLSRNLLLVIIASLAATIGAGGYYYKKERALSEERIATLQRVIIDTEAGLALTKEERDALSGELVFQKERVGTLAERIEEVTDTVGVLDKLSKTDRELLQKYSKVYFLNEHYVPDSLRDIPLTHLYDESRAQQIHTKVWPYLEDMILDAASDGVTLWIKSAYRSFGTQSELKSGYTVVYGTGANVFSADQGYSEHQLGTTVDFTTRGVQGALEGFENTAAYQWLAENAYKYGFTLSYPEGNTYYVFEPWHWRFVGVELATKLKNDSKNFYDVDQREINGYLISIFD